MCAQVKIFTLTQMLTQHIIVCFYSQGEVEGMAEKHSVIFCFYTEQHRFLTQVFPVCRYLGVHRSSGRSQEEKRGS